MLSSFSSRDLFLSPDERYQIWLVKAAERPELLTMYSSCNGESQDDEAPPLTDGCDIPSWRSRNFGNEVQAALNVGQGCSLLRRESQIPCLHPCKINALQGLSFNDSVYQEYEAFWNMLKESPMTTGSIKRIHYKDMLISSSNNDDEENCHESRVSQKCLHPDFERDNYPILILGCTDAWRAMETCQFDRLVDRFGHLEWRFSDTHAETMSLRTYQKYLNSLEGLTDDSPLAVYDSQFHHDERHAILDEYNVPECFDTDLFDCLECENSNDSCRPPYRWILIGGPRSGTGLHIDPVGTHAWVTLLQGLKRWVLFPPDTSHATIHMQDPQIPSFLWFREHYRQAVNAVPGAIQVLQRPGETVYVPAGWPHLVLNLELSVAITHNYATEYPTLSRLLDAVEEAEPQLAIRFRNALREKRPDLVETRNSASCAA